MGVRVWYCYWIEGIGVGGSYGGGVQNVCWVGGVRFSWVLGLGLGF